MLHTANPTAGYLALKGEIDAAIQRALTGSSYVLGPLVEDFERQFAAYLGVAHGVGVNSGTDAVHLALRGLGLGPGDEVITVSHTAVGTVAAIEMAGATPVLVDVTLASRTIDLESLAGAIGPATRAVVAVHLYGHPAPLGPLQALCQKRGLLLIEDCAQATGARWDEHRVGTLGDAGCFSFYPTKNLGGIGDGGMVVTRDEALANRLRQLRQYGWDTPQHSLMPGWNSRLDTLQAAVLAAKLPHLERHNEQRRVLAARYTDGLKNLPLGLPVEQSGCHAVYHLYVVEAANLYTRHALQVHLRTKGIAAGVHYPLPVHRQPAYAGRLHCRPLPNTEALAASVLSLPLYPEITREEQDRVISGVIEFFCGSPMSLGRLSRLKFAQHGGDGVLTVYPGESSPGVPFAIARVFTIGGVSPGGVRGNHAHRRCSQVVTCLTGTVQIRITDGQATKNFSLTSPAEGLWVPPGLWMSLTFVLSGTLVAVFCDQSYAAEDYLRDWDEFLRYQYLSGTFRVREGEYRRLDAVEETLWWLVGLRTLVLDLVHRQVLTRDFSLLDAGCGTGGMLQSIEKHFPQARLAGLDYSQDACTRAQRRSSATILCGSVSELPYKDQSFDVLVSLDVLNSDSLDPAEVIGEFRRVLRPGGVLILNVAAYQWLLSYHDQAVQQTRRFTGGRLGALCRQSGLKVVQLTYWNTLLFPLMVLRRKVWPPKDEKSDVQAIFPPLNALFGWALTGERALLRRGISLPFGGSLLGVCRKEF